MEERGRAHSAKRLDAFVDAAFAFAVTLLVIGNGAVPVRYADLEQAMRQTPAFAIGFAFLAIFWHGHVRWRAYASRRGALPVLISLVLVFLVLVYVYPLRLMSISLVEFITRDTPTIRNRDEVASLFALYGLGFMAMAGAMAALFASSLKCQPDAAARGGVLGETIIWLILAGSGLGSALLSRISPILAPWIYSLLPIAIGLFVRRH
ncbi:MAG TPA: TMEM175 family protein, partial [Allosphingosinicella sp.]